MIRIFKNPEGEGVIIVLIKRRGEPIFGNFLTSRQGLSSALQEVPAAGYCPVQNTIYLNNIPELIVPAVFYNNLELCVRYSVAQLVESPL